MAMEDFTKALRDRMVAQASLLATLTTHPTLIGTGREQAVIEMLRQFVPRRYEVLSGAVIGGEPDSKGERQIDVMVVDTAEIPTILRAGDIAVVLPQAVRAVVEVKSGLTNPKTKAGTEKKGETFFDAIVQIGRIRVAIGAGSALFAALVSYGGPKGNDTLRKWLVDVVEIRTERRTTLAGLQKTSKDWASCSDEVSALSNDSLPDLIVLDTGPVAQKLTVGKKLVYEFFLTKDDGPPVLSLIEQLVTKLATTITVQASDPRHVSVASAFKRLQELVGVSLQKDAAVDALPLEDPPPAAPAAAAVPAQKAIKP